MLYKSLSINALPARGVSNPLMKTNLSFISSTGSILSSSHPILIPALVACLLCSASHGREPVRVDLGKIALGSSCQPVALTFDKSDGRRFDSEGAGRDAERVTRELAPSLPYRYVR